MDSTTFAELLSYAVAQLAATKPLIPTYAHLLVSALFPIYIGAHASITRPSSAAKPKKEVDHIDQDDEDDEEEEEGGILGKMEALEPSDALVFPIMAGLTLGGLYLLLKWLQDPAILNKILGWYFMQAGITFSISFLKDAMVVGRSIVFPSRYSKGGLVYKVKQEDCVSIAVNGGGDDQTRELNSPLPGLLGRTTMPESVLRALWKLRGVVYEKATLHAYVHKVVDVKTRFGVFNIIGCVISLTVVAYFTFVEKTWWLTNFLGFSFAYTSLQFLTPTTFWTGSLLLSSLFFYDIYFVFFTPLMVTVATKLDIPVKLLFPRPPAPDDDPDIMSLAMLGLGDVVIPGMMIGLALRFDVFLYYYRKQKHAEGEKEVVKPQYRNATGGWGERFWTSTPNLPFPEEERSYHDAKCFPKTYFYAGVVGYMIGMIATLLVMQFAQHAQPALLYLVPGVLISLWGTAFFKGDLKLMWEFSDGEVEEEDDESDEKTGKEKESGDKKVESKGLWATIKAMFAGDDKAKSSEKKDVEESKGKEETTSDSKETAGKSKEKKTSSKEKPNTDDEDNKDHIKLVSFNITLPKKQKLQPLDNASNSEPTAEEDS